LATRSFSRSASKSLTRELLLVSFGIPIILAAAIGQHMQ
jgi:hypothetical protein